MAVIKPFKGIRPTKEKAAEVAAPPYDVMDVSEAREYVKDKPYSFMHIEKSEIDCSDDYDVHDQRIFDKGRENLDKFIADGVMFQDKDDSLYIYRQYMGSHEQTGIVACASVDDYINDRIKKHENTREDKEIERAMHIDTVNANTGCVFLTYRKKESINKLVDAYISSNKPDYDFKDELDVRHEFYHVNDKSFIESVTGEFAKIDTLYVADGHHRSAAATRIAKKRREASANPTGKEEWNYFLSVIFPDDQMMIMDYNRAVKDLNGMSEDEFMKAVSGKFDIEEAGNDPKPSSLHKFGMYISGKWYTLTAKEEIIAKNDPIKSLDVSILQENLLDPLLNIKNPRTDKRIHFIGGIRGIKELEKLVDSKKYAVSFAMFPTSMAELMKVADSGNVMPPKSTWFEPKLRSGIVIHALS